MCFANITYNMCDALYGSVTTKPTATHQTAPLHHVHNIQFGTHDDGTCTSANPHLVQANKLNIVAHIIVTVLTHESWSTGPRTTVGGGVAPQLNNATSTPQHMVQSLVC